MHLEDHRNKCFHIKYIFLCILVIFLRNKKTRTVACFCLKNKIFFYKI